MSDKKLISLDMRHNGCYFYILNIYEKVEVMKMTFEGSPEEIAKIVRAIQLDASNFVSASASEKPLVSTTDESGDSDTDPNGPTKFVTTEFARRMLSRRRLSEKQKIVFKTLADAHPEGRALHRDRL